MSFEGFSQNEINRIAGAKTKKHDVKLARKVPCHTKLKQVNDKEDHKYMNGDDTISNSENGKECVVKEQQVDENIIDISTASNLPAIDGTTIPVTKVPPVKILTPDVISQEAQLNRIQDFEINRKLMEEQNKIKRNILHEAISKHTEKTKAEAKKLNEIKVALDQLDSELATDVLILRKQIETATLHFNNTEKTYNVIEKNFLKAKQELYQAHEKKEMLTEHLYTIIAHNEDRKAKKLSELMEKVGLSLDDTKT
ncbi:CLUMA_CG013550, isoform A [Clunio marinus]|uniref:RAB6-interacting golgin n=1 Tax=Clunio marinus TaxID=568069 RepID=A0A1J1IJ63_9DIPT|nr:CLUMA_CG013550, isoform A [Clunio marinus]